MTALPKTEFTGYWGRAYHFKVDATSPHGEQRWYPVAVTRREAVGGIVPAPEPPKLSDKELDRITQIIFDVRWNAPLFDNVPSDMTWGELVQAVSDLLWGVRVSERPAPEWPIVTVFMASFRHCDETTRRELNAGAPPYQREVVSRGAGNLKMPCAISERAKNRKLDFTVNLNREAP